jgi:hypothetical protein
MARSRRLPKTEEEKTAEKIANLMKDSTIDLDQVGIYLGRIRPNYLYKRLILIAEVAEYETEYQDVRHNHDPLF